MGRNCEIIQSELLRNGWKSEIVREDFIYLDWRMPEDPPGLGYYVRCLGSKVLVFWSLDCNWLVENGHNPSDIAFVLSCYHANSGRRHVNVDMKEGNLLISSTFLSPEIPPLIRSVANKVFDRMHECHLVFHRIMDELDWKKKLKGQ